MIHRFQAYVPLLVLCTSLATTAAAQLYVSEVIADNDGGLLDEDGKSSDWIELYNDSTNAVDLAGWHLTDSETDLTQWTFPATPLPAKGFQVVFASGNNRAVAGSELHANFKLSASGEFVALVHPDGTTIESEFGFPAQVEGISWGYAFSGGGTTTTLTLVDSGAACTAHTPLDAADSSGWELAPFDDGEWDVGATGVGYERSSGYDALIGLDVEAGMYNQNATVYIRIPFSHDGRPVDTLRLRIKYDDGFAAYLNGAPIASTNAPASPSWNSTATSSHSDAAAVVFVDYDVSAQIGSLLTGTNLLAIRGLNQTTNSSDLLLLPELLAETVDIRAGGIETVSTGMLAAPTPGAPNTAITYQGVCETPVIAPERGFYDGPFQVTISNVTEGATVRYTTDGSFPTESNGTPYTAPIPFSGTTLLRAAAFKTDHQPSAPNTQTYLDIADVLAQDGSGLPPYGNWGHAGPDWAMDPTMTHSPVTGSDGQTFELSDALLDIPTVSLVTDWDDWWSNDNGPVLPDGVTPWLGIYADPVGQNGVRRPVSMEFFTADGTEAFARDGRASIVGGGIGGTSANRWKCDKLSMRVSFDEKLDYPVYGEDAAGRFNGLVLDAHMNFTWVHSTSAPQRANPKFLNDAVPSDLQNLMSGTGAPHSRFVHLYLNGLYWGLYDMHERPDEHFAAEYYGGQNEDYDSIKHLSNDTDPADSDHDGDPYNDNITGGDDADLLDLLSFSRSGLSSPAAYQAMAARLDIDPFIDYLLVNFYIGNTDWAHKNWYATRNRADPAGLWRYHSWDAEHCMEALNTDSTTRNDTGGPTEIHQDLTASAEYRLRFADRVHKHFFNAGALTPETATAVFWGRVQEIEQGVLGEAARWADNTPNEGHDWDEWFDHMTDLRDAYFPSRSGIVLNQFRSRGLYPATDAPEFEVNGARRHGGRIAPADELTIDSAHTVYYATDGSDPRAVGGGVAGTPYAGPLSFGKPTLLKARAHNGTEWSALCEAVFWTDDIPLAVTELMYHAPGGNAQDFVEIRNVSDEVVSLDGYKLDGAIDFHFRDGTIPTLAPGEYLVVVKDVDAFAAAYGTNGIAVAGEYTGDLDNGGEKVDLEFWNHDLITFRYADARNWPQAADGAGHSLVPRGAAIPDEARGSLDYGGNWRASTYAGGSPGTADPVPPTTVVLNEIVAHTDTGENPPFDSNDQIELYNPTEAAISLDGWYLSDDLDEPGKWAIPAGTVIPARGFALFDEDDFHPARVAGFGLNKAGELVVLSAPGRVADALRFKGQENGASLGRYPDGAADWLVTIPTPDAPNQCAPEIVWIRALMFHPPAPEGYADGDVVEYIQLENRGAMPVSFETAAEFWRIDGGVSYTFPAGFALPAGETLWLVSFDPSDTALLNLFCATYGLNASEETILGPYEGHLANDGERIAVERPQESDDPLMPLGVSWVVVDEVYYFDRAPWPAGADGTGQPLLRTGLTSWGVPTPDDTDADQLGDEWEITHFGSLLLNGVDDPDNDRSGNLQEYICGTNPTNAASRFIVENVDPSTLHWTAVSGRTYSVYWTGDLLSPFQEIASGLAYPQNGYTNAAQTANPVNYYYIAVEQE